MITFTLVVTDAIGGGIAATASCDCGESMRLQLDDDQLCAIAAVAALAKVSPNRAVIKLAIHEHRRELQMASMMSIDFTVWLLTHATNHTEQRRRDAAKGPKNDNLH